MLYKTAHGSTGFHSVSKYLITGFHFVSKRRALRRFKTQNKQQPSELDCHFGQKSGISVNPNPTASSLFNSSDSN